MLTQFWLYEILGMFVLCFVRLYQLKAFSFPCNDLMRNKQEGISMIAYKAKQYPNRPVIQCDLASDRMLEQITCFHMRLPCIDHAMISDQKMRCILSKPTRISPKISPVRFAQ